MNTPPPGLVLAAPASGTGKTTVALGLMRALRRAGLQVQPFKSGPDYIDPGFHRAATDRPSYNLDSWAMGEAQLQGLAALGVGADLVIAEASMGLFDGVRSRGLTGNGASADIAALMGWPVILILDASGQAQSAAAVAAGFASMRPDVPLAGVILNKVASPRHEALLCHGMEQIGLPVFGILPRREDLALPARHLGLVQAEEHAGLEEMLEELADLAAKHIDLEAVRAAARSKAQAPGGQWCSVTPPGQRIALARDAAFSFVYPHLLEGWRRAGAEIIPFSPLNDEKPDLSANVCWLPGGYPELYAGQLAAAENFEHGMRGFAMARPVHGECGGYMVLGEVLIDSAGTAHEMLGMLRLETSFATRKMHLGYRMAELLAPVPGYPQGTRLRGHEFHYATIRLQPDEPLANVTDAEGQAVPESGSRRGLVTGSFFHMVSAET